MYSFRVIPINELIYEESKQNNLEIETIKNNDNKLDISKSNKAKLPLDWVTKESKTFKNWAIVSNKGSTYVKCKFCCDANNDNNDLRVQSCYGKNAHQLSSHHLCKEYRLKHPEEFNEN